ncbi:hypothetical protein ACSBR2_002173 [Camellia fascicularis]
MGSEEPKDQLKGMDWKNIGDSIHNEPSAGPVTKKRFPRKVRQIPDCYFLPRRSLPSAIAFYGAWIVAGVGAGMLAEIWINKKVKDYVLTCPPLNTFAHVFLVFSSLFGNTFFTSTSAHVAHVENGNAVCKLLPMRKPQKTLALCLVGGFGKGNGKGKRNAILFLRPFMSSFKQPPPTSFEDLTPEAKSDLQHHSANPSNQGSSFASIGNLQSLNSIEDSLLGNFNQHHLANRSNRGSSFSSIGNLQSLNLVEDSLPENFNQVTNGKNDLAVEVVGVDEVGRVVVVGVLSKAKDIVRDSKSPALLGLGKTESGLSLEQGESVISFAEVPSISVNRLTMGSEGSLSPSSRSFIASVVFWSFKSIELDEIVLTDGFSFAAHIPLRIYWKAFAANIVDCFYDLEETYDEFFTKTEVKKMMHNSRQYQVPLQKYMAMMDLQRGMRGCSTSFSLKEKCDFVSPVFMRLTSSDNFSFNLKKVSCFHRGKILEVLKNWPERSIQVIVLTDANNRLNHYQGMGIPVGKLALYTALRRVRPSVCLPITIDVGTNNEQLLKDEFYVRLRQMRATGKEYADLLHEFMAAVKQNYGEKVLVQFEDFTNHNAFELLEKYGSTHLVFNDDIQRKGEEVASYLNGRCIFFVGMMGAEKTTVGKVLSEALAYSFVDRQEWQ